MTSCGTEQEVSEQVVLSSPPTIVDTLSLDLLIFKSENVLEVWQNTDNQFKTFQLINDVNYPIGLFEWKFNQNASNKLVFSSPFYLKKRKITAIPNQATFPMIQLDKALEQEDFEHLLTLLGQHQSGKLLIFPNKPSKNEAFRSTLNSAHWTPELHAFLELELKKYSINNGN